MAEAVGVPEVAGMADGEIRRALAEWGLEAAAVERIAAGLIHESYGVALPGAAPAEPGWVLQRVSPVFAPGIEANICTVTDHLRARGLAAPRLVPTRAGARCADLGAEGRWRLWMRIPGTSFDTCASTAQARSAGALVGRFHAALDDLEAELRPLGLVLHDPAAHLRALRSAVAECGEHPLHRDVAALAQEILEAARRTAPWPERPRRIVHGDLKLSNVLFDVRDADRAVALIDLDTLSWLPRWMDLADGLRSWCNPRGEDREDAVFAPDLHRAAAEGYLEAMDLDAAERAALVHGMEWICLELAARFATDALRECYFAWDPERFASRGEHGLVRARGQWALYRRVREARGDRARDFGVAA